MQFALKFCLFFSISDYKKNRSLIRLILFALKFDINHTKTRAMKFNNYYFTNNNKPINITLIIYPEENKMLNEKKKFFFMYLNII